MLSQTKLNLFYDKIINEYKNMNIEAKQHALKTLIKLPVPHSHMEQLLQIEDPDFAPAMKLKEEQRYTDIETTFEEAADNGIDNLDDFCTWIDLPRGSSFTEIIDKAHVYQRVGTPGKPAAAQLAE